MPLNVRAQKVWANDDYTNVSSVTFKLQYQLEEDPNTWHEANFAKELIANKANNWTVEWTNLPDTVPDGAETKKVQSYQVVEEGSDGWVQIDILEDYQSNDQTYIFTFTNSVTTAYSVEKVWNPNNAPTHEVTMGLYRTTDQSMVGSVKGDPAPEDEMAVQKVNRTVTLDGQTDQKEEEAWKYTFTKLPKYDSSGKPYYYYAMELDKKGNPIPDNGNINLGTGTVKTAYSVTYDWSADNTKTKVMNTTTTSLRGTKTWKDNGNAYNTRPKNLNLIL